MGEQALICIVRSVVGGFTESDRHRSMAPRVPGSVYNEHGTQRNLKARDEILEALKKWKQAMPDVTQL